MKILYCASEALPFAMSGGLGDVAGSLPKALVRRGIDCRVVLPLYGTIKPELREKMELVTSFTVQLGWRNQYCGVFTCQADGVTYYLLDNEYYFKRSGLYGFYDDGERFAFFSRAILEMLLAVDFEPDILHTNDWQTALVPVYLNLCYRHQPKLSRVKTAFTIHNIQYQGKYGMDMLGDVLDVGDAGARCLEYDGCVNFMKGAIESADKITTVSPTYAKEIMDPWYAHGLDALLRDKAYKTCGILNGIDTEVYNPETDAYLAANYGPDNVAQGKAACKQALRRRFGLEENDQPLLGMVTRLVGHKGLDLVRHVAEYIVLSGMQIMLVGNGDYMYESFFRDLAEKYPGRVAVYIGFNPELAHQVYAGADLFLMPSKSEPCGLAQMVALRYGTIPIVRETGGLKDSITDSGDGKGNGFTFATYNAHDMLDACLRAKAAYEYADGWKTLVNRALGCDFSWNSSAASYIGLYEEMVNLW
ncbi:MAG: glycogen synthase GlgA [Pygmaiobacter massiliensis]|nr:glycogen synthase GlgA [Pygmaiobacter massiliensis]